MAAALGVKKPAMAGFEEEKESPEDEEKESEGKDRCPGEKERIVSDR